MPTIYNNEIFTDHDSREDATLEATQEAIFEEVGGAAIRLYQTAERNVSDAHVSMETVRMLLRLAQLTPGNRRQVELLTTLLEEEERFYKAAITRRDLIAKL